MSKKDLLLISVATLVAGLLVGILLFKSNLPNAAAKPQISQIDPASSSTTRANASVVTPAQPTIAPAPTASSARLREMANKAQSYRAFFYEAVKHPNEGGYLYGLAILNQCKAMKVPARMDVRDPRRLDAIERLARRCDMSPNEIADAKREFVAKRGASLDDDPFLRQSFALLKAGSSTEKRAAAAAILDIGEKTLQALDIVLDRAGDRGAALFQTRDEIVLGEGERRLVDDKGLLVTVDGVGTEDEVFERLLTAIDKLQP